MPETLVTADPTMMMGKPVIKGTRITVELILEKLAAGESVGDILKAHPYSRPTHTQGPPILKAHPRLSRDAIQAALHFAAQALKADVVYPIAV